MVDDLHAGSGQLCMLAIIALSSGMHEREHSAKHGAARHSTAPHAGHDTARHRTALRRAVELAKLNGAGDTAVCFLCLQLYAAGCDTKK